jgi:hypothetical protein
MNCTICKTIMDPALAPATTHPTCGPVWGEPGDEDPFNALLKRNLIEIIQWAEKQNPRGHQVLIGPSEIGDLCDRRIGYRIAQIPACNEDFDPWAAVMGTAVHSWLQEAVNGWMAASGTSDWVAETTLAVNEFVEGHCDLYWAPYKTVIDWKTQGPTIFKNTQANGPSLGYIIQAHVYGYGFEQAGVPVERVALAFLSRAGWLKNMYVWSAPYDRSLAEMAMSRLYGIAQQIMSANILTESQRWDDITATPSNTCGFCPWYNPGKEPDQGADHNGCPGR